MKKIFYSMFVVATFLLTSCEPKNYKVQVCSSSSDGDVWVTMECPSIGIAGWNEVAYDGFTLEEVEEELFDKIRSDSYNGDYEVWVIFPRIDDHGNDCEGDTIWVSTLNGADVKSYASYSYFKGKARLSDSFPWNRKTYQN